MRPQNMFAWMISIVAILICSVNGQHHYSDALSKSIIFFQGQRSGKLPPNQILNWRSNSAISDGSSDNVCNENQLMHLLVNRVINCHGNGIIWSTKLIILIDFFSIALINECWIGGFERRLLRCWWQHQIRAAYGLHYNNACLERCRVRQTYAPTWSQQCARGYPLGHRLPSQSLCGSSKCALCSGYPHYICNSQ